MTDPRFIRNFSIVAHIDHGKTTLSDRILQRCNAVAAREMHEQMLDDMDLEKERGITIKARAVTLKYTARDDHEYVLNLIDTAAEITLVHDHAVGVEIAAEETFANVDFGSLSGN